MLRPVAYIATYKDGDHTVVRTFSDTSTDLAEVTAEAAHNYGVDPRELTVRKA